VAARSVEVMNMPSRNAAPLPGGTDEAVEPLPLLVRGPFAEGEVQGVAFLGPFVREARGDEAALGPVDVEGRPQLGLGGGGDVAAGGGTLDLR